MSGIRRGVRGRRIAWGIVLSLLVVSITLVSAGIALAGLSLLCGFALVWHIWWLAAAAFVGIVVVAIANSFDYHRDRTIPAEEVDHIEREYRRRLAASASAP